MLFFIECVYIIISYIFINLLLINIFDLLKSSFKFENMNVV